MSGTTNLPKLDPAFERKLAQWRLRLLDLSRRNRLLFFKPGQGNTAPIVFPDVERLYQLLVTQGKSLSFPQLENQSLFNWEDEEQTADTPTPARRYRAGEIGAGLPDAKLHKTLYALRARARTALEEQGVNVCFLAVGLLQWRESANSEPVLAPILMVPVGLNRPGLREPYQLAMLEDDVVLNPTLAYKLSTDFAISLPEPDEELDGAGLSDYFKKVKRAVRSHATWDVLSEAHLGIFGFQKLALFQDLLDHAAQFQAHPVVSALAGTRDLTPPVQLIEAHTLDDRTAPQEVFQVVDADSSQQEAIEAAKRGASFVLQGPPGTGKSQTITNIIAESLAAKKRVLFVSEKMAALEVVQSRLQECGLGDFCLELHNHKRDKREVVKELAQALEAKPATMRPGYEAELTELRDLRARLNSYARSLHQPRLALQRTPYHIQGELIKLRGSPDIHFSPGQVAAVDSGELAQRVTILDSLARLAKLIDHLEKYPWRASTVRDFTFGVRDRLQSALGTLQRLLPEYQALMARIASAGQLRPPACLAETEGLLKLIANYSPSIFELDLSQMANRFEKNYRPFYRTIFPGFRHYARTLSERRWQPVNLNYQQMLADVRAAIEVRSVLASPATITASALPTRAEAKKASELAQTIQTELQALSTAFGGELPGMGGEPLIQWSWDSTQAWLQQCVRSLDTLGEWATYLRLCDEAAQHELDVFVRAAQAQHLSAAHWRPAYLQTFYRYWLDEATAQDPLVRTFDSRTHTAQIQRFRELDRRHMAIGRARVRAELLSRRPQPSWLAAASSEENILRREAAKQRRLRPLRRLLSDIPRLILDLKPCLLMSPLTVSMMLDPEHFSFDLVIFDEASQISPEEAVGAILRGHQTIIVGDRQQLPPTRFFMAGGEIDDENEDYDEQIYDSVLEECEAAGLPNKMLLWHYRSRHESLIAFSNYHYYNNRLFTFPSATDAVAGLGLDFVHVPNGIYRRGQSERRNDIEARRIVDLIFDHFTQWPDRTLGVIALSMAQQEAILRACELRRREQPQFEAFFDENEEEPFFVKNLETVQGDERDTILLSIGYGPDESGKLSMNFGPVNRSGGERRLNVAVSRARYQMRLVSSMEPEQIDLSRTNSRGAQLLREYMQLARDGLRALAATAQAASQEQFDSPFERAVYDALTAKGLTVRSQVGVSGYRIDLGVVNPDYPGSYLLGIECDGAAYHSAKTARDRDRLRQQVLEGLGWRIHRIWSRDWLANPKTELNKVYDALHTAWRTQTKNAAPPPSLPQPEEMLVPVRNPSQRGRLPEGVARYQYTNPNLLAGVSDITRAKPDLLADQILVVVEAEGPVHQELVLQRLMEAGGAKRVGKRLRDKFGQAVSIALYSRANRISQRGDFLWSTKLNKPVVRTPTDGETPRAIEHVSPEELTEAVWVCLKEARSLPLDELIRATAQLLGYRRLGGSIDMSLRQAVALLLDAGRARQKDDVIHMGSQ